MKRAKSTSIVIATVIAVATTSQVVAADHDGFEPLFDGATFDGWEGNLDMFRIEQGAIVAGTLSHRIKHNDFLCTKKAYGDFELRLKAKLKGAGKNAGVQLRSMRIPDHFDVAGYQCDAGEHEGKLVWGALYDESRRRKFLAIGNQTQVRRALRPGGWNEFIIRCEGRRVQIWLNSVKTVDYLEQDDTITQTGVIGLQIHVGPPAEAWYKEIYVKQL